MNDGYKIDIAETLFEFFALVYFVFGLFTTYAEACTKLDMLSSRSDVLSFCKSNEVVLGVMNIVNIGAIIFCVRQNRRHLDGESLINSESDFLFQIVCFPLFVVSIFYLCCKFIKECFLIGETGEMTWVMTFSEMFLLGGTLSLISVSNKSRAHSVKVLHLRLNNFVLLITLIGITCHFIHHLANQQVKNFLNYASNDSSFKPLYPRDKLNETKISTLFVSVQHYCEPLVILFCFCCMAYIVPLLKASIADAGLKESIAQSADSQELNERDSRINSSPTKRWALKLPPISLLIGILFLTVTLIIMVLVLSLTSDKYENELHRLGENIITIFPIPIYAMSIPLLILQLYAMNSWPKRQENKYYIEKALLSIGTMGIITISLSETKYHLYINGDDTMLIFISYTLLVLQSILQYIVIAIALDREWKKPSMKTFHAHMCPTFTMFTFNVAFLIFALYNCKTENAIISYERRNETRLFLKTFNDGFYSIGITLTVIVRLYSAIVFGKITLFIIG